MSDPEENEITSVSQDDIDQLLQEDDNEPDEPGSSDEPDNSDGADASEEPATDADAATDTDTPVSDESNELEKEPEESEADSDEIEFLDDIDQLLQPDETSPEETGAPEEPGEPAESAESVSEADPAADEGAEASEDTVDSDDSGGEESADGIDDIEKLLEPEGDAPADASESAEPDASEEPLSGIEGADGDDTLSSDDAPVDDIDQLLEDEADAVDMGGAEAPDQVILEDVPPEPKKKKKRSASIAWRPKKGFLISMAVFLVFGAAFNILISRHGRQPKEPIKPEVLSFPITKEMAGTMDSTFEESPLSVHLKGFIVPAPLKRKDITYLTADVGLQLATEEAATMIKDQAPFFRSIIYGVMLKALQLLDKSKINEVSLKLSMLSGLNGIMPDRSVKDVFVDAFVMH